MMAAAAPFAADDLLQLLPRLTRFARALTRNRADADDLVQDTVEKALKAAARFQPGTRLDSWLFRIARNAWIDEARSRQVRAAVASDADPAEAPAAEGEDAMQARLALGAVGRAMEELPDEQREVAALILVDGASYREAAEILGVPQGTVTSRLARARAALMQAAYGDAA